MRRRVVATLIVAGLGLLAAACSGDPRTEATTVTTDTTAPATTTTEAPMSAGKQFSFYVPTVGDCYDVRPVDKAPPIYLRLDCSVPHQNEVFAAFDYTDSATYPGPGALEAAAKLRCPPEWTSYVGAPYETSRYEMAFELPSQQMWGNGIRHVVGCLIVDPRGDRITGSARGVGQ